MGHEWKATEFGEVVTDSVEQDERGSIQFYRNGSRRYDSLECEIDEESAGREILRLAARVRELEAAPDGLVAYNYITEGHRRLREALQAARLWRPRADGQGGAIDCAVEALARLAVLEEENARLRAAFPDLEMLRRADRLEEENRRLREGLGIASSFGGGTTCPDGEPHRAKCSRCDAPLKLTPPGSAA